MSSGTVMAHTMKLTRTRAGLTRCRCGCGEDFGLFAPWEAAEIICAYWSHQFRLTWTTADR